MLALVSLWAGARWVSSAQAKDAPSLPSLETSAEAYAYYRDAISALSQGDLQGAIDSAETGLKVLPNWVELRNLKADCLALSKRKDEAIVEYRISLKLEPANLHAEQALIDLGYSIPNMTKTEPFERQLVELVNQERLSRGLNQLVVHPTLIEIARVHSVEMRDRHYFSHESPTADRRTPLDRFLSRFERQPSKLAENIARRQGTTWSLSAENIVQTHEGLMGSPGHCANILDPAMTHVGVGIAIDERGNYWATELFMRMD